MDSKQTPQAVIYCRVSSPKQVKEGHGLESQETRCREFARLKNYKVIRAFHDEGVSGSLINRPAMQDLLAFVRRQGSGQTVVIIDDLSRLARDLEAHIQLRLAINKAGGKLESPSIEFGDDSDSILVENLLASVSQHQRQKNAEQSLNRMRARASNGYWLSRPPPGYVFKKVAGHGKLLVRQEPLASIVQEVLEGYASGRFESPIENKRHLDMQQAFPKGKDGQVHVQIVMNLLKKPLYAGYINLPNWGLHNVKAKHKALISFTTWQQIQDRLQGRVRAPVRKDLNEDFPLRGFVTCGCCGHPLTSCWSTGMTQRYAYYLCRQKHCERKGKSIRREAIEGDFEKLLIDLKTAKPLFLTAVSVFKQLWESRIQNSEENQATIESELKRTEKKVNQLMGRILELEDDAVIEVYENSLRDLSSKKIILREKMSQCGTVAQDFDESFRTAFEFLSDPHKLWTSEHIAHKRMAAKLVFTEPVAYDKNEGYRTDCMSQPFLLLEQLKGGKSKMVPPPRVELGTC